MTVAPDFRAVGRSVEPKHIRPKLTGTGHYALDLSVPGMLHAAVLRSDVPHALVTSLDVSRARAAAGVRAVLSRADLGFDDRVRQCGDIIAAVAADTEEQAHAALAEIEVRLDEQPPLLSPGAALGSDVVLNERCPGNVAFRLDRSFGDVDEALAGADLVLEETYRTGRPLHVNLTRHCCIASIDNSGTIVLMTSVDGPFYARTHLAHVLGIDESRLRIQLPDCLSSSFGGHSTINPMHEPVAIRLTQALGGRPVRFLYDAGDEFSASHSRHSLTSTFRSGFSADGRLLALDFDLLADHGPFPNEIARVVAVNSCDRVGELLKVENYRFHGIVALTNNPDAGEFRGIASTQLMYSLGSHLDEATRRLGIDPIDFWRINAVHKGHQVLTTGITLGSCELEECMVRGAAAIGWKEPDRTPSVPGRRRGIGMGVGVHTTGLGHEAGDPSRASIKWYADATAELMIGAPDSGQGGTTVYSQIAAEELGIDYRNVRVAPIDTATAPLDPWGTVAARGTYVVGAAVREAAQAARSSLFEHVAEDFDVPVDSIRLTGDGGLEYGETRIELRRLLRRFGGVVGHGAVNSKVHPPTHGAYFADVEVDELTGQVFVRRVAAALDLGFAINPQACRGQIEGAVAMGQELALYSSIALDDGVPLNASFFEYHVTRSHEVADVEAILVETAGEPTGPWGAKGIGTPAHVPVAPAIANAVRDALGVRVYQVPMIPEVVREAIARRDRVVGAQ
jgi:CO/xanthine dehydrogenase Mo-binding subunit